MRVHIPRRVLGLALILGPLAACEASVVGPQVEEQGDGGIAGDESTGSGAESTGAGDFTVTCGDVTCEPGAICCGPDGSTLRCYAGAVCPP
jgi:hypothetical protein